MNREPVDFKHADGGQIRSHWPCVKLDDVAKRGSGHTPDKKHPEYWNGDIKWVSLRDSEALDKVFIAETAASITSEGIANSSAVVHPAGTVILSRDAGVGKSAILASGMAVSQHFIAWQCGPKLDNVYLYYWLQHMKPEFERIAMGSTIKTIGLRYFQTLRIPLPPRAEQSGIAAALRHVDECVEALQALIAKKRDLKQAAMQQLLTGRRRLNGFRSQWSLKRVGDFADCTAGGTPNTSAPEYWGGQIRWMNSGELNLKRVGEVAGRITGEGLRNSSAKIIPAGCVLIGLAGQGKTRGTVAMNLVSLCTNQSIAAVLPNPGFVSEYLYHNLDLRYDELRGLSTGDGGRGGLNLTIIRGVEVPFPELPEQSAIAEVLAEMDAEIARLQNRFDKMQRVKQAMMQQLLTGRIRLI